MYTFKHFFDIIFEQNDPSNDQTAQIQAAVEEYLKQHENALTKSKQFIQKCMVELQREKPPIFFTILKRLKLIPSDLIETLAVDDCGNLYYNPMFVMEKLVNKSDSGMLKGVLVHEVMHILDRTHNREKRGREHVFDSKNPSYSQKYELLAHNIGNLAFDLVINRDVAKSGFALPEFGLISKFTDENDNIIPAESMDFSNIKHAIFELDMTTKADASPDIRKINVTRMTGEKAYDMFIWAYNIMNEKLLQQNLITQQQFNEFKTTLDRIK